MFGIHKNQYKATTMSNNKQIQYRAALDKFEKTYGTEQTRNQTKPIIFNVTGPYRNKLYGDSKLSVAELVMYLAAFTIITFASSVYLAGLVVFFVWASTKYYVDDLNNMFDGEIMEIDGVKMGVDIPTQRLEAKRESENFVETNDKNKLISKLNECKIIYDEDKVVTWSIGSTTGQCIDGQTMAPFTEVEIGVDGFSDEDLEKFLDAHDKILGHDSVLVLMNSAGYGVNESGGIVYSDNTMEYETIVDNVVPRTVGGTGNNENAMKFVTRLAKIHMRREYDFTLAIVPRGDKTMPQGGSHSKQIVLEHFLDDNENVIVIEISGKQTKMFELSTDTCSDVDSSEHICKSIKEIKILDENGKSHGSKTVFEQWV